MSQKNLIHFVLIPAYVLAVVTAIRTPLQILAPDHGMTKAFSSVTLAFVMALLWPILLQRQGLTYGGFLKVFLSMLFLARVPVAAAYGMAIAFQWTEPSGAPVRYIRDFDGWSAVPAALAAQFAPMVFGTIIGTVIWTITWAIAYRGKRRWSGAPRQ